jgi:hypothetical protein
MVRSTLTLLAALSLVALGAIILAAEALLHWRWHR